MPRPQFTIRSLLVAMLVVAAFFTGIQFEPERQGSSGSSRRPYFMPPPSGSAIPPQSEPAEEVQSALLDKR